MTHGAGDTPVDTVVVHGLEGSDIDSVSVLVGLHRCDHESESRRQLRSSPYLHGLMDELATSGVGLGDPEDVDPLVVLHGGSPQVLVELRDDVAIVLVDVVTEVLGGETGSAHSGDTLELLENHKHEKRIMEERMPCQRGTLRTATVSLATPVLPVIFSNTSLLAVCPKKTRSKLSVCETA